MSLMAFLLMASDLRRASRAWLRAAASCFRDARDCSSSAWTSERQARMRSHGGLEKKKKRRTGPRFNTHSGAAPRAPNGTLLFDDLEDGGVSLLLDPRQLHHHSGADHARPCNHDRQIRARQGASGKPDKERRGPPSLPSRSCDNFTLASRSRAASSVATWSWLVTWENWQLVVAKSDVAVPRSRSSSDTFASRAAFS
jgi:hypothetical protein